MAIRTFIVTVDTGTGPADVNPDLLQDLIEGNWERSKVIATVTETDAPDAPNVTTNLLWRVKRNGSTVAAFDHLPSEGELHAIYAAFDGERRGVPDDLSHYSIHFETEAI